MSKPAAGAWSLPSNSVCVAIVVVFVVFVVFQLRVASAALFAPQLQHTGFGFHTGPADVGTGQGGGNSGVLEP
jgi:hypothetical protein